MRSASWASRKGTRRMSREWNLDDLKARVRQLGASDLDPKAEVDNELGEAVLVQDRAEQGGAPSISLFNMPGPTRRALAVLSHQMALKVPSDAAPIELVMLGLDLGLEVATIYKRLGREWPFE